MNFFDQCLLAPLAVYRSSGELTAVGVTTRRAGQLYTYFMNDAVSRGPLVQQRVEADRLTSIFWSADTADAEFENVEGSLLICLDSNDNGIIDAEDGDVLTGNAFLVNLGSADVAFLPTFAIDDANLAATDPLNWSANPVIGATTIDLAVGGSDSGTIDMQYLIDGTADSGDDTLIYIWATGSATGGSQTMTIHDGDGASASVTVQLPRPILNALNPEAIGDLNGGFVGDGYLRWQLPEGGSAFAFSIIFSPRFGAVQTVLGNY